MSARIVALAALALSACTAPQGVVRTAAADGANASAQRAWAQRCEDFDEWDKPGPPFRIFGQTYYVGTCGITSLLVAGPGGHTLIDSGTDKGAEVVLANIRALGFDPRDVKTVLMTHEHFDHVGGMARIQAATGAAIIAAPAAAAVLKSGRTAADDPQAGSGHPPFPPVTGPVIALERFERFMLGDTEFTPIATPGHTPGATSWRWRECEAADRCATIVYADSMNPISDDAYRFTDHPALLAAFRQGIAAIAASDCDIVIAPHPGAVDLRKRLAGEAPLVDPNGCKAYAAAVSERLDARLAREAAGG